MFKNFEDVERLVVATVTDLAPEPLGPGVDPLSANLVDDFDYHSVALVELGFTIEELFGLDPITAEDVEDVRTPMDLARFVAARLAIQPG